MLAGKMLEPVAGQAVATHSVFTEAARGGVTILVAAPGSLLTEGLATALTEVGRRPVWLRLGVEDRDPATLLVTMVAAVRRQIPGFGTALLARSGAWPGPIFGWDGLYQALGAELADQLPSEAALVLENADRVDPHGPSLELACRYVLPALPAATPRVVIGHATLPGVGVLKADRVPTAAQLEAPDPAVALPAGLGRWRRRVATLLRRSAAVRAALAFARSSLTDSEIVRIFRASSLPEVLTAVAQTALSRVDAGPRRALARILRVGYAAVDDHDHEHDRVYGQIQGPWFQPLVGGWSRIRTVWQAPLAAALAGDGHLDRDTERGIALGLLRRGAVERAIPLLAGLDDQPTLAWALRQVADDMIASGQWGTLGRWLDGLSADALEAEPVLLDAAAHVAFSRGRTDLARCWLDMTATAGQHRPDAPNRQEGPSGLSALPWPPGQHGPPAAASRRLLAASRLTAIAGDLAGATSRAEQAEALARVSGDATVEAAAAWHLGGLHVLGGDPETAAGFFQAAAKAVPTDPASGSPMVAETDRLVRRVVDLRRDRREHAAAAAELARSEEATMALLRAHLSTAFSPPKFAEEPGPDGAGVAGEATEDPTDQGGQAVTGLSVDLTVITQRRPPDAAMDACARPEMVVHVLGPLSVAVNGQPVAGWGSRQRALLAYLVLHRADTPVREVVMEALWPGVDPAAARNSLQVAVSGLRRVLREATRGPVVVFERGIYRLAPDVAVSVDADVFEHHVRVGRRVTDLGRHDDAVAEWEAAVALYRGDFLAGTRTDDWMVLPREQFRLTYLEALDQLSSLYLGTRRYAMCALLCRQILDRDPCREDAHRRLMRCHSRQGQPHLALLQFRTCADVLARELRVAPGPATIRLQEKIRRHEPI
ncbi:BTAD domain-containing putative transcriptional regulator [Parafrankia sp. EUN1f]|uniref:BTAD domain-containing putative transcriptional regulator n=1 Tax=Parafrankia sp. EUN1f TaxID=102897 RepID=UPI0001C46C1B|nr:BTAD domain-containing putative transcriptional regulator [Parafrankia sp. EUN1f]EFC80713.1 transcriptional regulator, SARP family [Parafrankia sp. EUN1f]